MTEGVYEAIWAWTAWWMSSSQFDCMLFVFPGSDKASGWAQMLKATRKLEFWEQSFNSSTFQLCFQSVCVFLCTCVERWVAYVGRGTKCDGDLSNCSQPNSGIWFVKARKQVDLLLELCDMWRLWIVVLRQRTVYDFKLCLLLSFFCSAISGAVCGVEV